MVMLGMSLTKNVRLGSVESLYSFPKMPASFISTIVGFRRITSILDIIDDYHLCQGTLHEFLSIMIPNLCLPSDVIDYLVGNGDGE